MRSAAAPSSTSCGAPHPGRDADRADCVSTSDTCDVLEHKAGALRGVLCIGHIQRHIGATRLEHAQYRPHQLGRTLQAEAHPHFRTHALPLQIAGQLIGTPVQLSIGPPPIISHDRRRIGRPFRVRLEQLLETLATVELAGRLIPLHQQLPLLIVAQQRQPRHRTIRLRHDPPQQLLEVADHPLHGGRLKQIGIVFDRQRQCVTFLPSGEGQVELRRGRVERELRESQIAQFQLRLGCVFQRERHLEQRMPTGIPLRIQGLHQPLKRQFLVFKGLQRRLPHLA